MNYKQKWDMESVFPGGSTSDAFQKRLSEVRESIATFSYELDNWELDENSNDFTALKGILQHYEKISNALGEMGTFANGLVSADVTDQKAMQNLNAVANLRKDLSSQNIILNKKISALTEDQFSKLLEDDFFKPMHFPLEEIRQKEKDLLSTEEETIINHLSLDGLQGWGNMYNQLVASIQVPVTEDNETVYYSAGQFENKMKSEENPKNREELLKTWEATWAEKADLFSTTLNHLSGFRLNDYELHDYKDYMKVPLDYNRMKEETLDTMWDTITKNKTPFKKYFERKAQLIGVNQLGWLDVSASVDVGDYTNKQYTYNEAATFIIDNFKSFSPKMAEMARRAFEEQWIEAEDRPGKRPGGYCSNLPESKQSRIFMTFAGSTSNVSTLAHELGHAFHSYVLRDLPLFNQRYAMNVAETASTFAELVVSNATIENATSDAEKINLLDEKIARSATFMMNIHARYIFERNLYDERQQGTVDSNRLKELMEDAQKEAYQDALRSYHPMFWATKLHFHITGVPFYNFPYTFGYFFSLGIYNRFLEDETLLEDDYIALLRDTASMTTEDLAEKHLNVDLRKPDFWQKALDSVHKDIEEFLELTESYI
jgi:pepF/M3 family oligoendopeptidase